METLMKQLVHNPLKVHDFINLMGRYGLPFRMPFSKAADFYVTLGNSAEVSTVLMCFPSCFEVGEYVMKTYSPNVLRDIYDNKMPAKLLRDMNMRDILLEVMQGIYINYWGVHTVFELGAVQRNMLLILSKYGYVNDAVMQPNKLIFHHTLLDATAVRGKAIKRYVDSGNGYEIPVFYLSRSIIPLEGNAKINAYIAYRRTYGMVINNPNECFWRLDTSFDVVDYLSKEEVDRHFANYPADTD